MRTLATPTRRRPQRGAGCDDAPRLWGTDPPVEAAEPPPAPAAPALVAPVAVPEAPVAASSAVSTAPVREISGPTLDDLMSGAWDGLSAGSPVTCPVCAAEMTPRWSAGAGVVGGRCGGCGTTIE